MVDPELQRIDELVSESTNDSLFELPPELQSRVQTDPEAAEQAQETFLARGKWLRSRGLTVAGLARLTRLDPAYGPSRARIAAADTVLAMLHRAVLQVDVKSSARALKGTYSGAPNVLVVFRADSRNTYASAEGGRALIINVNNPSWQSVEARTRAAQHDYTIGFHPTAEAHGVISHELGHLFHYRNSPSLFTDIHNAGDFNGWAAADNLGFISEFGESAAINIARRVSRYAATNPLEFVGEVYEGLATGRDYSAETMLLYRRLGGVDPIRPKTQQVSELVEMLPVGRPPAPLEVSEKPLEGIPEGVAGDEIRMVLVMHDEGKSYREIERVMGWPNSNGNRPWKIVKKYWHEGWNAHWEGS